MMHTSWTALAAALCIALPLSAAELKPFVLPSQNAPPPSVQQQRAPANVSNSYYDRFARDVSQMDQLKINALRADFQKRLTQARSSKREDEQAHYERMLGILDGYGKKVK